MNNRIDSLDSLRGIAAMIVVIFHCLLSFNILYEANYFNNFNNEFLRYFTITPLHTIWAGKEAVLLFFVLSGFVLAIPYYTGRNQPYSSYIVRRFFRIYIPYIVIMMLSVVLVLLFSDFNDVRGLSDTYDNRWNHDVSFKAIFSYFLMLDYDTANVNGVVWTLFHEMRISFIFPLFVAIISRFNLIKALVFSLGLNIAIFLSLDVLMIILGDNIFTSIIPSFKSSLYYCTFFILGAVLSKYRNELTKVNSYHPALKFLLFILSLILINCRWVTVLLGINNDKLADLVSVTGILLLFAVVLTSNLSKTILTKKPLLWLGKVSFSLYLIHIPVLMMTTIFLSKLMPIEFAFLLVPLICLPIAHLTYNYVEVLANNWGKSVSKIVGEKLKSVKIKKAA
ncbi:acyltransferase [Peribacillus castrilensis]|uniref:acyltransferase family protein n=1 Tax=Peribacillus castrilensis TaxID=2897690 RepID=UPI003D2A3E5B